MNIPMIRTRPGAAPGSQTARPAGPSNMFDPARPKLKLKIEYEEAPARRYYVETCVVCGRVDTLSGWSDDPPRLMGAPHVCHTCDARRGRRPQWPWTGGINWRDARRLSTLDLLAWHLENAR